MLRSAQVALTWPSSDRSEFDSYREIPTLHPTVIGGRAALVIRDSTLLRELFGLHHPETADCRFRSAEADTEIEVEDSVRYVGRSAPLA